MPLSTGTLDVSSLLRNQAPVGSEGLLQDEVAAAFQADLDVHNRLVTDMMTGLAETTTDRQRLFGSTATGEMQEVDEYARATTQKVSGGQTLGFPLRLFQFAVDWTRKFIENQPVSELANQLRAAQTAHRQRLLRQIKRAFYLSANYTFRDRLVAPVVDLAVKRFLNADGTPIPLGPNGEVFNGATHTHYLASATLTAASVQSLVDTIAEHGVPEGGTIRLNIARADRASFEALAGFKAYPDPRIIPVTGTNQQTIELNRLDNLAIGTFGGAEVWVKPWAVQNYVLGHIYGGSGDKPLVVRTRNGQNALTIAAELNIYPLHAQYLEAEFDAAVWNRSAGAVLFFAGGVFADPNV